MASVILSDLYPVDSRSSILPTRLTRSENATALGSITVRSSESSAPVRFETQTKGAPHPGSRVRLEIKVSAEQNPTHVGPGFFTRWRRPRCRSAKILATFD